MTLPEDLFGLSRPSPLVAYWPEPVDVRVMGESVTWDQAATRARSGRRDVGPDLLEYFAALDRAGDFGAAVVDFVRTFGPLGVDLDGAPLSALDALETSQRQMRVDSLVRASEPLSAYRCWSSRVAAVLPIVGSLTSRRKVSAHDQANFARVAYGWTGGVDYRHVPVVGQPVGVEKRTDGTDDEIERQLRRTDMRGQLSGLITSWLSQARIGIGVQWPERKRFGELSMVGGGDGCLASVLLQLALTMTRAESAFRCAGCSLPFTPRRIPRPGQRAFCDVCRSGGVPQKLATRDMRERKANERRSSG